MAFWRRRLHRFAFVWLVWQVSSLTAIVPVECCTGHTAAMAHGSGHPTAAQCPMRGADGQPCPMHRQQPPAHADHGEHAGHHPAPPVSEGCVMNGACRGPLAGFLALISNVAVLPAGTALPVLDESGDLRPLDEQRLRRLDPPDSPPPRS